MNGVEKRSEVKNPSHEHRNMNSTHLRTEKHSQQNHQPHHDPVIVAINAKLLRIKKEEND